MSRGKKLQEMETGTTQSKTAVNANAQPAETAKSSATPVTTPGQTGSWEDLGGPTPENSKPDDDSNTLKTPGSTLKQVRDVVNSKAQKADPMPTMAKEEVEESEEEVEEEVEENQELEEQEQEDNLDELIDEDINALLSGEELSEEFKEKSKLIFESALRAKIEEVRTTLEEHYAVALQEEVEEIKLELTERVDSYLEYVSGEWMEENAIAIENGLKTEITESFITGMKGLFEEHYVSMPDEKYDVLESMVEKLDEMETKLNEQIERNIALNTRLAESSAGRIFNEISEGLAVSQKDKLLALSESVEFESEENYREKLVILRESYFPRDTGSPANDMENLTEESNYQEVSPSMGAYLKALSNVAKK